MESLKELNEADVEIQRLIPLLVDSQGLRLPLRKIKSKPLIEPLDVGKGSKRIRGYIPDFLIFEKSLPVMVVEVKKPEEKTSRAYSEARLYAGEINARFPHGVNPCQIIMAFNGIDLWVGNWDTEPSIKVPYKELNVGSKRHASVLEFCGSESLEKLANNCLPKLANNKFSRPFNQGSGQAQILSRKEPNSFAADLAPILRRYFSSHENSRDEDIYSKAYISSNEITKYDRILESYLKDRVKNKKQITQVKTTKKRADDFSRTLSEYNSATEAAGQLQLVTGAVGAGKSLFARRYKEFLQPTNLKIRNTWAFLNFNDAPDDYTGWESFICDSFLESLSEEGLDLDLTDPVQQETVFAPNLHERRSYYQRVDEYESGRGHLEKARDLESSALAVARYVQSYLGNNLIVVFDNVDRRDADAQLSAFQNALWFLAQTRCLVILQMRDSTFEAFKDQPPLDTYKTGQIFHISPPRFIDVVKKRLELSLDRLSLEAPEEVMFETESGATFKYPKKRSSDFLRGIYLELFQSTRNASRILEALAGRNVRRALDMFLALLTSGHIPEENLMEVARGGDFRPIPEFLILRALMRQDYRFYNEHTGFVSNIFFCSNQWSRPSNFLCVEILFQLINRKKVNGDNGQMGYVSIGRLFEITERFGFLRDDVVSALDYLMKNELVETDGVSKKSLTEKDCLKASASAWAHMRILSERIEYLAAVLPTTPVSDEKLKAKVFDAMQVESTAGFVTLSRSLSLVEEFHRYLRREYDTLLAYPGYNSDELTGAQYIVSKIGDGLRKTGPDGLGRNFQPDLLDI